MQKRNRIMHETPAVVTVPLILLAIPSAIIGWFTVGPVLFGNYFGDAIQVKSAHDVLTHMGEAWHGSLGLLTHSIQTPVFWLAAGGAFVAWFLYLKRPDIPGDHQGQGLGTLQPARSQVLLRRSLHQGIRGGWPESWQVPVAEGRRTHN